MALRQDPLSAEQLDSMSPNERSAAFRERVITDLAKVPDAFRTIIEQTAEQLEVAEGYSAE
jgi:hypothetical protein